MITKELIFTLNELISQMADAQKMLDKLAQDQDFIEMTRIKNEKQMNTYKETISNAEIQLKEIIEKERLLGTK